MKKGLGKGLAALIGDLDEKTDNLQDKFSNDGFNDQASIPIEFLTPNRNQPRKNFSETSLDELSASIKQKGVLLPILVRQMQEKDEFQIIAGERRWRAAQKAGLNEVPVIIRKFNESEVLEIGLIENMQRENLNAIEEALGFERLQKEYEYTQETLSKVLSKSRAYVANAIRLLSLPHKIQQFVQNGDLSPGHARTLIVLSDPLPVAKFAIKKGMSVRQLESYVSYLKNDKKKKQNKINTKSPDTLLLEKKLTDSLGLAVEIIQGSGEKGELKIKFLTFDQLNLVCEKIS
ncbi:MAG: ParB/RepB/Spo0J family partition protein [Rhizobiales bacterium TMED168]|nr:MAG: ParB/RepB/Spo0J family partition protein [Rhizobiales bacterium TMED168]|tara:strand:- start:14794 stop:15663 length:870 start_codon:yes stop_codon:yes gene_type:complete